ncbi:cytochrome c551 [Chungangia koreensis]|uniref:Cytochrome c551 n=1 Tax=Chungangia koreensis TaxID=752657 RepID=A0ABV8X318_9LACT
MKKKFMMLLLGAGLVLGACGGGNDNAGGDNNNNGGNGDNGGGADTTAHAEEVLNQSCISCHGQNLEGGMGPSLNDVGGRLSADEIRSTIENGKGQMPPGLISGEDLDAVVDYLSKQK